jgi:hypothetical protein
MSWAHWSDSYIKVYIVGEVPGSNPADSHYILYNNINQTMGGTRGTHGLGHVSSYHSPPIRTRVNTRFANNPPINTCHVITVRSVWTCHVRPYRLYGQVQSASNFFACLAWRTNHDIFSIRTSFEKVNIPPESGRRDRRNGTIFVAFRAL